MTDTSTPSHRAPPGRARMTSVPAVAPRPEPVVGAVTMPEPAAGAPVAAPAPPLVSASTGPRVGRAILRSPSPAPVVTAVPEAVVEQAPPPEPVEVVVPPAPTPIAVGATAPRAGRYVGPAVIDWRGGTAAQKVEAAAEPLPVAEAAPEPEPDPSFVDDMGPPVVDVSALPPMPAQQHNAHVVERHARRVQAPVGRPLRRKPPPPLDDTPPDMRDVPF